LVQYINDSRPWASYEQRRQLREALPADAELDLVLNRRRDLEQYPTAADPCQAALAAFGAVKDDAALADYIPALKAAEPPVPAAPVADGDPAAEPAPAPAASPACDEATALLATVRTDYARRFPDAFVAPKGKKKPAVKKKKKPRGK